MTVVPSLPRRCAAEAIGTALLLATVVGSGIMGERLAGGNAALALLANSLATGAALVALILAFAPVSAHFNPVVTLTAAVQARGGRRELATVVAAQMLGAWLGVIVAHLMFSQAALQTARHPRTGAALLLSEFVATFGLIAVIASGGRRSPESSACAVGLYITAAYWFTASTAFANPAVTLARAFTATFTGIRLLDVPAFVVAQFAGGFAAMAVFGWLLPASPSPILSGARSAQRFARVSPRPRRRHRPASDAPV